MPAHINPDAVRSFFDHLAADDSYDGALGDPVQSTADNFGITPDQVTEIVCA